MYYWYFGIGLVIMLISAAVTWWKGADIKVDDISVGIAIITVWWLILIIWAIDEIEERTSLDIYSIKRKVLIKGRE